MAATPDVATEESIEPTPTEVPSEEATPAATPHLAEAADASDADSLEDEDDEEPITDLTGGADDTSKEESPSRIDSEEEENPEPTIEQLGPELTISRGDGFTDLLIKYRPDLDPAESYDLFKYLTKKCGGAEHIFTDVEIYPLENGDPGIKYTGTTRFAPGVQELVDNWMPGQ